MMIYLKDIFSWSRCNIAIHILIIQSICLLTACKPAMLNIRPDDKQVMITAKDLLDFDCQAGHDDNFGTFKKSKSQFDTYTLKYKFNSLNSEGPCPVLIDEVCQVMITSEDARSWYTGTNRGVNLSLMFSDLKRKQMDDSFGYGDDSRFEILYVKGIPVGNYFNAKVDNVVYTLILVGVFFDDAESWQALIKPKLARLKTYYP